MTAPAITLYAIRGKHGPSVRTRSHLDKLGIEYTEQPLDGFKARWAQERGLTSMPIVVPEGRDPWCGYQPELLDGLVSE